MNDFCVRNTQILVVTEQMKFLARLGVIADSSVVRLNCACSISIKVVGTEEEMISSSAMTNCSDYLRCHCY